MKDSISRRTGHEFFRVKMLWGWTPWEDLVQLFVACFLSCLVSSLPRPHLMRPMRLVRYRSAANFPTFRGSRGNIYQIEANLSCASMAKRTSDSDDESPHTKRQKLTGESVTEAVKPVRIQTSNDLHLLLVFEQDAGPDIKNSKIHTTSLEHRPLIAFKRSSLSNSS